MNRKSQHYLLVDFVLKEKLFLTNLFNFSEEAIKNVDKEYSFDMVSFFSKRHSVIFLTQRLLNKLNNMAMSLDR